MAHEPIRTCVGCGALSPQSEQLRIGKNLEGRAVFDSQRILPGRGAWIHADDACIDACSKSPGLLMRSLHGVTDFVEVLMRMKNKGNGQMATIGKRVGS